MGSAQSVKPEIQRKFCRSRNHRWRLHVYPSNAYSLPFSKWSWVSLKYEDLSHLIGGSSVSSAYSLLYGKVKAELSIYRLDSLYHAFGLWFRISSTPTRIRLPPKKHLHFCWRNIIHWLLYRWTLLRCVKSVFFWQSWKTKPYWQIFQHTFPWRLKEGFSRQKVLHCNQVWGHHLYAYRLRLISHALRFRWSSSANAGTVGS